MTLLVVVSWQEEETVVGEQVPLAFARIELYVGASGHAILVSKDLPKQSDEKVLV